MLSNFRFRLSAVLFVFVSFFSFAQESNVVLDYSSETEDLSSVSTGSTIWIFVKMILVLALIVVAIYFIFRFMKSRIDPEQDDDEMFLRKVSSLKISTGKSVQVVTLNDEAAYVIGVSEDGITLIDKVENKELITAMNLDADKKQQVFRPKSFAELLEVFSGNRKPVEKSADGSAITTGTMELLDSLKNKTMETGDEQ